MGNCALGQMRPAAYSPTNPQAALDVEVFEPRAGHATFSNGALLYQDDDVDPIDFSNPLVPGATEAGFIGRAFDNFANHTRQSRYRGDIAEIVIYAAPLTSTEIAAVSDYLAARWNLTITH
jgi:hypothetical protein